MYIARFKNGTFNGYNSTPKTLDEMRAIKVGEDCFEVTQIQHENITKGWSASESGEVVTVTEPVGWQLEQDMKTWKEKIAGTDSGMPRYLEDLITTNSLTMTSEMKVRYDAKIKIRGERP
tara:strand:- start:17 stop:376 length:360 start_codon:yes stop_codon:yes gene_type:complete